MQVARRKEVIKTAPSASTRKQQEELLALLREKDRRTARDNIIYFFEQFLHVEDKDGPELVVPFKLWEMQRTAIQSIAKNRLNVILKARQLGFSWIGVGFALHGCIFRPGYSALGLSKNEDNAKELIRRAAFMLRHMPSWLIKHKGDDGPAPLEWDSTALQVTIYRKDGEPSTFQSFAASENAGRGFTGNLVILDEWAFQQFDREIWAALFPTVNRPTGGKVFGLSTIKRNSLFSEIWLKSKAGENNFNRVFLPWYADPRRTPEWYEETRKNFTGDMKAEYPATEEEAFAIPGGAFFDEVREHTHIRVKEPIPKFSQRYVSIDYGLDKAAVYWYWVDSRGSIRIYRELAKSNMLVSEVAEKILELQSYIDPETGEKKQEHIMAYLAPPDLVHNRHRETGKTTADIFAEYGIYLTETSNDRVTGWQCVKELLKPNEVRDEQTGETRLEPKLTIENGAAPYLWTCFQNVQHNPNKYNDIDSKGAAHEYSHGPDSLRAFSIYWITPSGTPQEKRIARWEPDQWDDYYRCRNDEERAYLIQRYGDPFG